MNRMLPSIGGLLDDLEWLEHWYKAQCNGEWEHDHGLSLTTIDNPGWSVKIDLLGTDLEPYAEDSPLFRVGDPPTVIRRSPDGSPVVVREGGPEWMECFIKDQRFEGAGDSTKLRSIVHCFRRWATSPSLAQIPKA